MFELIRLNLPEYTFRFKTVDSDRLIFDEIRKKYLVLTPEEWVRQNLLKYLVNEKSMPQTLISVEGGIKTNTLIRRYDCLIHDRSGNTLVLVECKAPAVKITQKTFDQAFEYNFTLKSKFILISNGLQHFFCSLNDANKPKFLNSIPSYSDLLSS